MNCIRSPSLYNVAPIMMHLLLATALFSCAAVERQIITDEYAANPVSADKVQTLTEQNAADSCRKVAVLRAKGELPEAKMLKKLRKAAGKLGANRVMVVESRRSTFNDVMEGLPQAAAAGALGMDAKPPPAKTIEAAAYYCVESE